MKTHIIIVGAGPVGLATTLALAQYGYEAVCVGPAFAKSGQRLDTRTSALFQGSVQFLKNIQLWDACRPHVAQLKSIRLIEDTNRLLRAPETCFDAAELGYEAFGYNISNHVLVEKLHDALAKQTKAQYINTKAVTDVKFGEDDVAVTLSENQVLHGKLVIGADGRNSICRQSANIETISWHYEQSAITCNFEHSKSHQYISNEFHTQAGPFTTVPLGEKQSSLVWVERPGIAEQLMQADTTTFRRRMEQKLLGLLGKISEIGPRACYPLSGLTAKIFAQNRIALVGEAAHVMPPIGAQGLNLGFRDAAMIVECITVSAQKEEDVGSLHALSSYNRLRRADVWTRTFAVDLLNRSLLSSFLPIQAARFLGMNVLKSFGPLRRFLMRQGMQPDFATPKLFDTAHGID